MKFGNHIHFPQRYKVCSENNVLYTNFIKYAHLPINRTYITCNIMLYKISSGKDLIPFLAN